MPTPAKQIYVNGRFLTQSVTGVQRYAREMLCALDCLLDNSDMRWTILAPPESDLTFGDHLKNIQVKRIGRHSGHIWEQLDLWLNSRGGRLINFCNTAPLLRTNMVTVIHDAIVYRHPDYFKWAYRTLHQTMGRLLSHRSRIATVSEFSRRELSSVLNINRETISVIPNGSNHLRHRAADESILDRLDLECGKYFLFVGSPAPHKNLKAAITAFGALPKKGVLKLAIVGASTSKVFGKSHTTYPEGVKAPGRLTDEEVVALYRNATAFIFPSFYEGFGIPPLEAFANDCPVIASDIPACREVCKEAALYFNPNDPKALMAQMQALLETPKLKQELIESGRRRVTNYDWNASAKKLLALL